MRQLLILRPRPGADLSAARAGTLGLEPVVAPIFTIAPLDWAAPDPDRYDALLLTSANAARCGGDLRRYADLPCYAVGETSAGAAREAGFGNIRVGPSDGVAVVAMMASDGVARALHLAGREHIPLAHPAVSIERRAVYAAEPVAALPGPALEALRTGALALLHSPRAAEHFTTLVDAAMLPREMIEFAAISQAAADAAGTGWKCVSVAAAPRDEALLELAAKLCKTDPPLSGPSDALG